MPLAVGARLGPYEIVSAIGAGGMGEVYRARDTKLGRAVAIKVILDEFSSNQERIGRFEREAKMLAALHHHRIASLFGLEHSEARHFLVMELVEGETLAERLRRGALPVEEALPIAIQIAEALEAAHEKGVVHRDLKPANVKITPDGQVKVLDFGLAKAIENEATAGNSANSPTLSMVATQAGLILGTAAYMSPEQAKGFPADHRSDIFSFGVVLAEMLSGRPPFRGDAAPEILASVLVREPDTTGVPADVHPRLLDLITRCLEKSPKKRWQAIGDVRAELEAIAAAPRTLPISVRRSRTWWSRALPAAVVGVVAAVLGGTGAWVLKPDRPRPVSRFVITLPTPYMLSGFGHRHLDVSPDGERIAYVASGRLYVRELSQLAPISLPGLASVPFVAAPAFSPDGRSIAFYSPADRQVRRVGLSGGSPLTIGVANNPLGLSWDGDDIFVGQGSGGVLRLSANGGRAETVVKVAANELAHGPQLLPDGEHLLFSIAAGDALDRWDTAKIVAQSLRTGERKVLIQGGSDARYLPPRHIIYMVGGTVFAVRFDPRQLSVSGAPVSILEGVRRSGIRQSAGSQLAVSRNGVLVYVAGPTARVSDRFEITLVDRSGKSEPLKLPPGTYESPRVSPDGKRIAFNTQGVDVGIRVYEVSGNTAAQRVTFGAKDRLVVWCGPKRIVFQSNRDGDLALFQQDANAGSVAARLTTPESGAEHFPDDCSPDGTTLLFTSFEGTIYSLWTLTLPDKKIAPFGDGVKSIVPSGARFSRDGRWVAYAVVESSLTMANLLVQPFPTTGARYQLPKGPADDPHHPLWSPDGKEILDIPGPGRFEAVPVITSPTFVFGEPVPLLRNFLAAPPASRAQYDMMPDGRLLGLANPLEEGGASSFTEIRVVLNWFEELKNKLPK